MFGSRWDSDRGQLALLDAVVFFVIAMAVSSMIFRYSGEEASRPTIAAKEGQTDPGAVLGVLLRASIGNVSDLELNGQTHVQANSDIATCILAEVDALTSGEPLTVFDPLNERIMAILVATCSAVYSPYLVAGELREGRLCAILAIPNEPPVPDLQYASSVRLAGMNGEKILLTLILSPSFPSEVADV